MSGTTAAAGSSAYDQLPDGVVATDAAGEVVYANPAATRILGTTSLTGRPLTEVLPFTDQQGRDWWQCLDPFNGLATRVRQPERELTMPGPDGNDLSLLVTASFVRNADRSLDTLLVCLRDTASKSRTERSGAELVSVVAHELRSPLTSVKGFTATLLGKWDRFNDEQKKLMLQTINGDADRVTRLISELLDVSRIETGRLEVRKQVVDFEAIVRKDVAARVAAGEPEDRFNVTVTGEFGEIWADPDKTAQVVGNVIENALRHGAGTVFITIEPHDGGVRLTFVDEGDGVSVEAMPRVFTKFWRGTRRGGTGLGLYIAKGIMDAHGGTISIDRSPDAGARVVVTLPAGTPSYAS